jgi:hypothetical protein
MTEIYLILEGEGFMELDGERIPAKPMMSIFIKPGCRHRLVGKFKIVNVAIPAFDPRDEWFYSAADGRRVMGDRLWVKGTQAALCVRIQSLFISATAHHL